MAALKYRDEHNKIRFLEKPKGSTDYHQGGWLPLLQKEEESLKHRGWTLKYVKTFTDDQLKAEFDKIRNAVADLQAQNLRRSLKRPGADVEQPGSKKSKSSAAPQTPVPAATHQSSAGVTTNVHQSPFVDSPPSTPAVTPDTSVDPPVAPTPSFATPISRSSGPRTRSQSSAAGIKTYSTRRKSLATRKMSSSEVDLNAPDKSFIQVLSDDDSDDSDDDTNPFFWHAFAAWEVVPTGLGDVNALYFTDKSSKYFTHLREILHLLDRQDLSKLYGMVVKHYEVNPLAGVGYLQLEIIHHILSASLMQKILKHKLEVEIDGIGNDMTYAVQLIKFIKNQLASSAFGWFLRFLDGITLYVVPTGRVIATVSIKVSTGRYIVPAGYIISPGLEVGSIRHIQGLDTAYWGFLGVGTMLDIFQNIHILFLEYGVLSLSGYGVLSFNPMWSLVSTGTDTPYLP
ncbi:hypothetical protein Tco_1376967 [Tanacetum coccineum]